MKGYMMRWPGFFSMWAGEIFQGEGSGGRGGGKRGARGWELGVRGREAGVGDPPVNPHVIGCNCSYTNHQDWSELHLVSIQEVKKTDVLFNFFDLPWKRTEMVCEHFAWRCQLHRDFRTFMILYGRRWTVLEDLFDISNVWLGTIAGQTKCQGWFWPSSSLLSFWKYAKLF